MTRQQVTFVSHNTRTHRWRFTVPDTPKVQTRTQKVQTAQKIKSAESFLRERERKKDD